MLASIIQLTTPLHAVLMESLNVKSSENVGVYAVLNKSLDANDGSDANNSVSVGNILPMDIKLN
jgi:hypothetical protein